ncbi:S8 family serine peptidase [bacterium]|nr:S8 family serine peptidase [bacterium]
MRVFLFLFILLATVNIFSEEYILKFKTFNSETISDFIKKYDIKKLFSINDNKLLYLKQRGEKYSGEKLADLRTYFKCNISEEQFNKIKTVNDVELIYLSPKIVSPNSFKKSTSKTNEYSDTKNDDYFNTKNQSKTIKADSDSPNFEDNQGYLFSLEDEGGADSQFGWDFEGGAGESVTVTDMEYDWILNHEDLNFTDATLYDENGVNLTGTPIIREAYPDYQAEHHGTSVLGEIAAKRNGFGVTGMAHKSNIKVVSSYTREYGYSNGDAIIRATSVLNEGDIILLEAQSTREADSGTDKFIPIEYYQAEFDAIKTATANGIIIIEAAGNGDQNLDDQTLFGNRFQREVRDSGAIIVGAGAPPSGTYGTPRSRLYYSTYGSRVDVQAWGWEIYTTGYGDIYDNGETKTYTAEFGGTSGASPIITAISAQVQGRFKALNSGDVLTPTEMREILKNPNYSYKQMGNTLEHIGPFPNIKLIFVNYFQECNPLCDFWERCVDTSCLLKDGYCETDSNCENGLKCSQIEHICKDLCENIICDSWKNCNSENGVCELNNGFCDENSDCFDTEICNDNHICVLGCENYSCSENSYCESTNHTPDCICENGYEMSDNGVCIKTNSNSSSSCSFGENDSIPLYFIGFFLILLMVLRKKIRI